jgi:D-serine deaminase-like pyridoxal phosphate-dependent protein
VCPAQVEQAQLFARLEAATAGLDPPLAAVDLANFDLNAADLARRAAGRRIRVASKSVRCRALLRRALARPGYGGVLAYALPEALWLAGGDEPVSDDIVVAYPSADRAAIAALAAGEPAARAITLMVDSQEQLDLIDSVVAPDRRPSVRVCLDVDASLRLLGGRVHVGTLRSPVRSAAEAAELARRIADRPGFTLVGLMAYEGQIAGVGDDPPGRRWRGAAVHGMQAVSAVELRRRRRAVVAAVRDVVPLEFVNGGGTGSLERTASEPWVSELAAGSGLYGPSLFDAYRSFTPHPAALFALPVVRRPGPGVVTVFSGGWPASGPPGADRVPVPVHPAGLRLTAMESAGEVQTPVLGEAADRLRVGDRVWFRHAKAGELCERVDRMYLVAPDGGQASPVPTYRGEGRNFG